MRDNKRRKASELGKDLQLKKLIEREEQIFERKFENTEGNGLTPASTKPMDHSMNLNHSMHTSLSGNGGETSMRFMKRKINLSKQAMSSYSNARLSQYVYGLYNDNALTYLMRIDDRPNFQYVLQRGIKPSCTDASGMTVVHYAIMLEKIHFLSFLLECEWDHRNPQLPGPSDFLLKPQRTMRTSMTNLTSSRLARTRGNNSTLSSAHGGTNGWMSNAASCLEKCTIQEGHTALHLAVVGGNIEIFEYLMNFLKNSGELSTHLLRSDAENMTALLLAARSNHMEIFKQLILEHEAECYVNDIRLNNVLHYAVINENEEMVNFIVRADAEKNWLKNERNIRGHTPEMISTRALPRELFSHVWEFAAAKSSSALQKLQDLIDSGTFDVNEQTLIGRNTPLHFAALYENFKAL